MPRYEFYCPYCGSFERWRALSEATAPMSCPQCQRIARKVYTAPGLVRTPPVIAQARYRAEKSAFEPEVVRRERPVPQEELPSQVVHHSHGRPWMIGHEH